jgi:hypothetical protein
VFSRSPLSRVLPPPTAVPSITNYGWMSSRSDAGTAGLAGWPGWAGTKGS